MKWSRGLTRRDACIVLQREAMAAFGVFILLLNILSGSLSHTHYDAASGLTPSANSGKMAICSGKQMIYVDEDGNVIPTDQGQGHQHDCACCLLMQASAVIPPPPHAPEPLQLAAIQVLRAGDIQHLNTAAIPTRRNRGPPSQA
jgi:hypothetical protein